MANNFLSNLLAEWYELQGYFIRKTVLVGKRRSAEALIANSM